MQPTIIGLDLAKSVFQVHGVDERSKVVIIRLVRREGVRCWLSPLPWRSCVQRRRS